MPIQKGRDLLLKLDNSGSGAFITVAGLRSRRLTLNAQAVDVTHADSEGQWRELLAGAGIRRASLSGGGVFKDATSDIAVRTLFFSSLIRDWQIIIPGFATLTGPFQITTLDYAGEHDAELTFDIGLESAGALTFVAV
jgi:TP901-1 family phage major tail protein